MKLTIIGWGLYVVFAGVVLATGWHDGALAPTGPFPAGKYALWAAWAAFLAYSVWVSTREDIIASVRKINELHWGRQICIDLYLGFTFAVVGIGLVSRSWTVGLAYLLPVYLFGNLATLLWLALHFDAVVGRLAG